MDEAEWLRSVNPRTMLAAVRDKGSDRLWRLLAVACVRAAAARMRYPGSRKALAVAERFADGEGTPGLLREARAIAEESARLARLEELDAETRANFHWDMAYESAVEAMDAADAALCCVAEAVDPASIPEGLLLADLLREIFGNPFRWVVADPAWLVTEGGAVRGLAEAIYHERAFDRLPILADALEDAGCADADLLGHLRGPGPHLLGCWALDLVLGKS
jgi:hypothetical protein